LNLSDDKEINKFSIYPNPLKDYLSIQFPKSRSIKKVVIVDIAGKKIFEQTKNISQVNVSRLKTGIYIILIYSGSKNYHYKFIKNNFRVFQSVFLKP